MSTDRELLELAALAGGIDIDPERYDDEWGFAIRHTASWWNARNDDGDALRLRNKLWLELRSVHGAEHAGMRGKFWCTEQWFPDGDQNAATRLAIVRAAAAIGEGMAPFPSADEILENWT